MTLMLGFVGLAIAQATHVDVSSPNAQPFVWGVLLAFVLLLVVIAIVVGWRFIPARRGMAFDVAAPPAIAFRVLADPNRTGHQDVTLLDRSPGPIGPGSQTIVRLPNGLRLVTQVIEFDPPHAMQVRNFVAGSRAYESRSSYRVESRPDGGSKVQIDVRSLATLLVTVAGRLRRSAIERREGQFIERMRSEIEAGAVNAPANDIAAPPV